MTQNRESNCRAEDGATPGRELRLSPCLRPLFLILAAVAAGAPPVQAGEAEQPVTTSIKHADTYYWFGMAEKGNMEAFRKGLEHLDRAASALDKAELPGQVKEGLRRQIEGLRLDLENQADMAHDTLFGVFPLIRLLAPSLFVNAAANGTFEMIDDPDVISVTTATQALSDRIIADWKAIPQLDVVFTSAPRNPALENEALYIFNSSSKYFVHNLKEIEAALPEEQAGRFLGGEVSPGSIEALCKTFGVPHILVVTVRELDVVDEDYFFLVEGRLFKTGQGDAASTLFCMGFCRDRRGCFLPFLALNAVCLLLAVTVFAALLWLRRSARPPLIELLLVPLAGFTLGRVLPWILTPMIGSIAPGAETLAILSFWWPCAAGAALLLGPLGIYRIASKRLQGFVPALGMDGKGGAVFVAIAFGFCAWLSGPLLLLGQNSPVAVFLLTSLAAVGSAYLLGRTLDKADSFPLWAALGPAGVAPLLGAGLCMVSVSMPLVALAVLAATGAAVTLRQKEEKQKTTVKAEQKLELPEDPEQLAARAENPPYHRFSNFQKALDRLRPLLEGRTAWVALVGPGGVGKTATARELIEELTRELEGRGQTLTVLAGECPEKDDSGSAAYAPFRKALADHFSLNLLAPPGPQLEQIDNTLEQLFESVVPFSGLLFPAPSSSENAPGTREEIFISLAKMFRQRAKKNPVLLMIDDAHWMDPDSRDLLLFLQRDSKQGEPLPFAVIVTGRPGPEMASLELAEGSVGFEAPAPAERTKILVSGLGIEPDLAEQIVSQVSGTSSLQGELFWLFEVVSHFAREGVFVKRDQFFRLSDRVALESLPYPRSFMAALDDEFDRIPQHRPLLQCAACLGLDFAAGVLASSIGKPRLEVLHALSEVENSTGLVKDVKEKDDVFAFRSSFVLETVRRSLAISGRGPRADDVPQVIREYHARVADTLAKDLERSQGPVFDVARHYYAAGASRAQQGFEACRRAAWAASEMFSHDKAREYLEMAAECARALGRDEPLREDRLRVDAQEAHVAGVNRPAVAERFLAFLEDEPECPAELKILAARSAYDAGSATGDQRFFQEAVKIGLSLAEAGPTNLHRAEGFHFVGVSLPTAESEERLKNLRAAFELVDGADRDDLPSQALRGRIANSLAEQLSYCRDERRREAEEKFLLSLSIKERPELRDKPGLARSYGGLGRYHLFSTPPEISKAREFFLKDEKLSAEIGDLAGLGKMKSFLADCEFREGNCGGSAALYAEAFEKAQGDLDRFFAGAGWLESLLEMKDFQELNAVGAKLAAAAREAKGGRIPGPCRGRLKAVLAKGRGFAAGAWSGELEKALQD